MPYLSPGTLLRTRYRVEWVLGQGGFGAVYKARDTHLGNRPVAVKEMSQTGLSSLELTTAVAAFQHEAHLLATLLHPNLPRMYDHFLEAGHWYLVMDYIAGQTLEEKLEQTSGGKLAVEEVLTIGIQLCTVLDYLHTSQPAIIFRDLKPANVMLTADGQLYLIDFGIARHFKPGQAKDTTAFGSAGYAAPEQYGKTQTTPRADIYSLGATLHQLLTGSDPTNQPFFFAPLPAHPALAGLDPLIQQMVALTEHARPASMALVKQDLQRIASWLAAPIPRVPAWPAPAQPSRLSAGSASVAQGLFCPTCGSLRRSTSNFCSKCGTYLPSPSLLPSSLPPPPLTSPSQVPASRAPSFQSPLLSGHPATVIALIFHPDGRTLASGSADETIKLWEVGSGKELHTLTGHVDSVSSLVFSPDGGTLASGSRDKTIKLFAAASGVLLHVLLHILSSPGHHIHKGPAYPVIALAFSPDGRTLASGSADKTIKLWEVASGKELCTLTGHTDSVSSLAFSSAGPTLASGSWDKTIKLWDVTTRRAQCLLTGHTDPVTSLAFSPDGRTLASGSSDKTIKLWEVGSGKELHTLKGHTATIYSVIFSPTEQTLASGSWDNTIGLWDAANGILLHTRTGHTHSVTSLAFSPDGHTLASGSADKAIRLWAV